MFFRQLNKETIRQKLKFLPEAVLFLDILIILCLVGLACFSTIYPEGDVMEHIKASYKVYNGEIPYRDFFEHHNPLLWYLTGWIVNLFIGNITVIYWVDYITYLFFLIGVYYAYKTIIEFLGHKIIGYISVLLILLPNCLMYYVYFKPDNYMLTCISVGVYYFFRYIRDIHRKDLVISYLFLWLAFMFIQKAVAFYPVFGGATLWLLYKKHMPIKDFVCAIILPVVLTFCFLFFWWSQGILDLYWKCNFIFNSEMVKYMGDLAINIAWTVAYVVLGMAGLSILIFYKSSNIYFRILSLIVILNVAMKYFYFSPHVYYWYEAYYFAVPIAVLGGIRFVKNSKLLYYLCLLELQIYFSVMGYYLYHDIAIVKPNFVTTNSYVEENINRCDYNFVHPMGIYGKDMVYYWFLHGQLDVVGSRVGLHEIENVNEMIKKYRPKFVYVDDIYDRYEGYRENKILVHKFDMDLINKLYDKVMLFPEMGEWDSEKKQYVVQDSTDGLYILKSKYRKYNCKYNEKNRRWEYDEN